jgi:tetratricopeptide (TPR) repeat protein
LRTPLPLKPQIPGLPQGQKAVAAAIGNVMPVPSAFKSVAEQQARLRMGAVSGLKDALSAPATATAEPEQEKSAVFLLELGLTLAAMGNVLPAITELRRAVAIDPDLGAAWRKLADLLGMTGQQAAAEACLKSLEAAGNQAAYAPSVKPPSDAKLQAAERAFAERMAEVEPAQSGETVRQHLRQRPTDIAALRILAEIARRSKRYAAAETVLERALQLAPEYMPIQRDLAEALCAQSKYLAAEPYLERLIAQDPGNAGHKMLMALCQGAIGHYDKAIPLYESLADELVKQPTFLLDFAHHLKYVGRREDSVQAYRACLEADPGMGDAWWSLANFKNEKFSDDDIAVMRAELAKLSTSAKERINLHFTLGAALEQIGDYENSFQHYAKGNALKRTEQPYDAAANSEQIRQMKAFFTPERFDIWKGGGHPDPAPIFIVSMPRAGSTLVEQILASHSMVEGTHELTELNAIVRKVTEKGDAREQLALVTPAEMEAHGQEYIRLTRAYRQTDKPFFIDKMPSNWAHIGLIQAILPNAKIIDARRHPMASCFSNFKQLFGFGAHYTYGLTDLGRFYADYVEWMAHVDAVLPGRVHRVIYERMVADAETETRRLLEYCGLPFEPACLRFYESKRAVATPSSEQVRQPIYKDGLEQWKNFEPWLDPLKQALNRAGTLPWDA